MKTLIHCIAAFFAIFLLSCQTPVVFTEPQPAGEPELSGIPKDYHGLYWCDIDSIALTIGENIIFNQKNYEIKLSVAEIDSSSSNLSFNENLLYSKELNESFPAVQIGDTIIAQMALRDTLFSTKTGQVLKSFKGHLVLNQQVEGDLWDVTVLSLKSHDVLSIAKADIPEKLEELEQITRVKQLKTDENMKPIQIKIAPTPAEFDRLVNEGVLFTGSCMEFRRIIPVPEISL